MPTKIEWAQNSDGTRGETWNPVVGCTRVSPGCDHCYAARMSRRLEAMGKKDYVGLTTKKHFNGVVRTLEHKLSIPLKRMKPTTWFVNSMSDLFHEDVPVSFIKQVWKTMWAADRHVYQILTKRPERMAEVLSDDWFQNAPYRKDHIWLGTSVEDQQQADKRIPHLLNCPAAVRFLSCEPLLGSINLHMGDSEGLPTNDEPCRERNWLLHWVIVGGESGPGARPMHPEWARSLRDQCVDAGVSFFFKQWGNFLPASQFQTDKQRIAYPKMKRSQIHRIGSIIERSPYRDEALYRVGKKFAGRLLDGREWNEMPSVKSAVSTMRVIV